jgi:hypothetical protein
MKHPRLAVLACSAALAACASKAPAPPVGPGSAATPAGAAGTPASASVAAAPPPRSPEAILADAVAATGGAPAWRSHKTAHFKLETTFQGMGMGGTGERYLTSDGKSLTVAEFSGLGKIGEGTNGKVFWAEDPVHGFRFLEGAEAEEARVDAAWNPDLQAKELFTKLESANDVGPDGKPLECVIATMRAGAPTRSCYDRVTHLQVVQTGIKTTPDGDVPFRDVPRDWRDVGGIKIPFESETQVGPVTQVVRLRSVTFDEPIDAKIFEPPAPKASRP